MNTFFFLKVVTLNKAIHFGPYIKYDSAVDVIDYIQELLMMEDAKFYTVFVEERTFENGKWQEVTTKLKVTVNQKEMIMESVDAPTREQVFISR